MGFEVGNIVEIIGNIPYPLQEKEKPLLGRIVGIDGFYILVKPKYQRWVVELYSSEIKYINSK